MTLKLNRRQHLEQETTLAVKTDYYELLGIPRDASADAVDKAVREQMSVWRKRVETSDLSAKQEAERRMELLAEARTILRDGAKRSQYDRELATGGVERPSVETSGAGAGVDDWVGKARAHIERNDYQSAVYATKMALQLGTSTPELWYLRSRANVGLGELQDALYEAREAVNGDSGNLVFISQLAIVHEFRKEYRESLGVLDAGLTLDPGNRGLNIQKASLLLDLEQWDPALHITKFLLGMDNKDMIASRFHVAGLIGKAEGFKTSGFGGKFFENDEAWAQYSACVDEIAMFRFEPGSEEEQLRAEYVQERDEQAQMTFCLPWYPIDFVRSTLNPKHKNSRVALAAVYTCIYSGVGLMISFWLLSFGGIGVILGLGVWVFLGLSWWQSYKPAWKDRRTWIQSI